jgi:hypothetical protein
MKRPSKSAILAACALILTGCILGSLIGNLLYGTVLPVWEVEAIGLAPKDAVDILYVDYRYPEAAHLDENTLYFQTPTGAIFAGLQGTWQSLSPLPGGQAVSEIRRLDNQASSPIVAIAEQGGVYQANNGQWEVLSIWRPGLS